MSFIASHLMHYFSAFHRSFIAILVGNTCTVAESLLRQQLLFFFFALYSNDFIAVTVSIESLFHAHMAASGLLISTLIVILRCLLCLPVRQ